MCAALACAAPAAQSSTESGRRRGKNGASAAGGDLIRIMAELGARPLELGRGVAWGERLGLRALPLRLRARGFDEVGDEEALLVGRALHRARWAEGGAAA